MSRYSNINDILNLSVSRTNAIQLAYSAWGMRLFRTMPWSPILTDPESVVFTRYWTSFYSSNRFLEKCCSENSYSLKKRLIKKYYPRYLKKMPQPRIGLKILPTKLFWSKAANKIKKVRPRSYSRAYSRVQTSQVASKTYVGRKLKKNSNLQNLTRYFAVGLTGVIFKSPITIKKSRQNAIIRRNPQYTRRYRLRRQKVAVSPAVLPPGRADLLDTWTENLALFKQQEALADQRVLYPSRFLGQDLIMYRRLPVKSSLRLALVSDHWSRSRLGYFYRAKQLDRSWVDRSLRVLTFQQEMFRLYGSPSLKRKLYSKKKKATIAFYRRLTPRCLRSRRRRRLSSLVPRVRSSRGCKVPLVRGYVVLKKKTRFVRCCSCHKGEFGSQTCPPFTFQQEKSKRHASSLLHTKAARSWQSA